MLFTSNVDERPTIFSVPVDGGPAEPLFTSAPGATDIGAEGWAPDGRMLLFYEGRNGQVDIGSLADGGKGPAQMQVRPRSNEWSATDPGPGADGRLLVLKSLPRAGADSRAGQVVFLENVLDRLAATTAANVATGDSSR